MLIHDNITIVAASGINSDQNANLIAQNDFSSHSISVTIHGHGGIPGWAIFLIVAGSLAIAGVIGVFAYKTYMKKHGQ